MGLLAAVEQWVERDHEAEWREWQRRLQVIAAAVAPCAAVRTSTHAPGRSNVTPTMSIQWEAEEVGVTPAEVRRQLSAGEPRIEVAGGEDGLSINPYMMEEGEEEPVARRLAAVLAAA